MPKETCALERESVCRELYHFWLQIFAVNFAKGVLSGWVMTYQFGTNWRHFSAYADSVTSTRWSYKVLTA